MIVRLTKYYSCDQIKNEMGWTRRLYGGEDRCVQGFVRVT
jgi:hypothetical protein